MSPRGLRLPPLRFTPRPGQVAKFRHDFSRRSARLDDLVAADPRMPRERRGAGVDLAPKRHRLRLETGPSQPNRFVPRGCHARRFYVPHGKRFISAAGGDKPNASTAKLLASLTRDEAADRSSTKAGSTFSAHGQHPPSPGQWQNLQKFLSEIFELERAMGFEPTTPTLARLCSTTELRPPAPRCRRPVERPLRMSGLSPIRSGFATGK